VRGLIDSLGPEAGNASVDSFFPTARGSPSHRCPRLPTNRPCVRTHRRSTTSPFVGGGPQDSLAAVYGASEGLHTVDDRTRSARRQAGLSSRIENYLGFFLQGSAANDLGPPRRGPGPAISAVEILAPQKPLGIRAEGPYRFLKLATGLRFSCHALLLAMGFSGGLWKWPGSSACGAGVYYGGGTTEAMACKGETVHINRRRRTPRDRPAMPLFEVRRKGCHAGARESLASTMSHYFDRANRKRR